MTQKIEGTILIVDDNPINLTVLVNSLRRANFDICMAENGRLALAQAQELQPDLILLDVMMPGIDGFETCRRLKANVKTKDIPVIFMTALSDTSDKIQGLELGAVDYVIKPLHPREVLSRLTTHLTIHRLQSKIVQEQRRLQELEYPLGTVIHHATHLIENFSELEPEKLLSLLKQIQQSGQESAQVVEELLTELKTHIPDKG